jgi:serine/threonine protein kinase
VSVDLYIAPEIYKDELFDVGVDVYSFGLILYEVLLSIFHSIIDMLYSY